MRERWFFVQGERRRGPFSLAELVAAVRGEPDPRAVLIWRKGLREWTLAEVVPEVAQRIARPSTPDDTLPLAAGEAQPRPATAPSRVAVRLRLGLVALAVLAGIMAILIPLRRSGSRVTPPSPATTGFPLAAVSPTPAPPPAASPSPSSTPAPAARLRPTPSPPSAAALAEDEADLPGAELGKLRGVAAWSGDTLKLTIYNATRWRVTEVHVRIERFSGEEFVADDHLIRLTPPPQRVDVGVADLLARVAPDRKKPGLNSLDTGVFEATAGARPAGFRWRIDSARGYPPLR